MPPTCQQPLGQYSGRSDVLSDTIDAAMKEAQWYWMLSVAGLALPCHCLGGRPGERHHAGQLQTASTLDDGRDVAARA